MAELDGKEFEEIFNHILPDELIRRLAKRLGVVEREREHDVVMFTRAMVIGGQSHEGGRQADMLRAYVASTGTEPARSGFYRKFDSETDSFTRELLEHAMSCSRAEPALLPGILGGVTDWLIADSSTVRLRDSDALKTAYPGAGDYAAIKVHKIFSVGRTQMVDYHFSPARDHDSKHLTINESWRGHGLLADLGYASIGRLRDCEEHDVKFVIRLKDGWKPRVDRIVKGEVIGKWMEGSDLDLLIEEEILRLNGRAIDLDAWVGGGFAPIPVRVVGVRLPDQSYGFYLTNIPRKSHGPKQISTLYRLRWQIESDNKLDKSCMKLDKIDARTPESVRIVLRAALIGSILVNFIVHRAHLKEGLRARKKVRDRAPIHPMALARMLAVMAVMIGRTMRDPDSAAAWEHIASAALAGGRDPNWRNAPSIHDELRGYLRTSTRYRTHAKAAKSKASEAK